MSQSSGENPRPSPRLPLDGLAPDALLVAAIDAGSEAGEEEEEASAALPAHQINGFFPSLDVTELIGQGGMGSVYKATQLSLNRAVAVKVLPVRHRRSAQFEERFHREAQALARLNHPNIVTIFDFGQVKGLFYFIMEYVEGQSVAQLIRAGQMSPHRALRLVPRICDALEYAHGEGIVHRDIKPGNILVDRRGRVKVVDFGLAKLLDGPAFDLSLTRASQVMGTPQYMAPEQLENPLSVDHRADIYSLGVVIYEMLTGKVPTGHFPRPSERAEINPKLDDVVMQALASEPSRRFQAVSELHERLDQIEQAVTKLLAAKERPLSSEPTPKPLTVLRSREQSQMRVEFSFRLFAGLGLALALGILGALYWLGGWRWLLGAVLVLCLATAAACLFAWLRQKKRARLASRFLAEMKNLAVSPEALADPGAVARLSELKETFGRGIETLRAYGKDPFAMPWYVLVGEPGAGKTEAIRHGSLRFPEGLQDRLQGVGGTYSMHWWFTNHAIILDTAGAMFLGQESGDRFGLFLRLLRQHRPGCPINGIILAIPSDSLLLDCREATAEKAGQISRQLSLIQRQLEVRFPIYLMVTKSDKIPGFREFFDAERHGSLAKQMVGWSHSGELDQPPTLENLEQALGALAARWRRRRLALVEGAGEACPRRADGVDSLFTFPAAFEETAAGLRHYLSTLFASSEWALWPPFFRGIYFTSSLREGEALDQDLAKALGVPADRLPQQAVWKREGAFFLRDLYLEKIFRENGLVTALRNTARFFRRQLSSFYGWSTACLAILLGLGWLGSQKIRRDMERDSYLWQAINREWSNGAFAPLVQQNPASGEWRVSSKTIELAGRAQPLENYLQELLRSPEPAWGGYWGISSAPDARLIVLEGCLVKPLLEATRAKLSVVKGAMGEAEAKALVTLLELESSGKEGPPSLAALAEFVHPGQISPRTLGLLDQRRGWLWWRRDWVRQGGLSQALDGRLRQLETEQAAFRGSWEIAKKLKASLPSLGH